VPVLFAHAAITLALFFVVSALLIWVGQSHYLCVI
jgi:hypothetical protein